LTTTSSIAPTRTRWVHRFKALPTRGDERGLDHHVQHRVHEDTVRPVGTLLRLLLLLLLLCAGLRVVHYRVAAFDPSSVRA